MAFSKVIRILTKKKKVRVKWSELKKINYEVYVWKTFGQKSLI